MMGIDLVKVRGQLMIINYTSSREDLDIFKGWYRYEVKEEDNIWDCPYEISETIDDGRDDGRLFGVLYSPVPFTNWDESRNGRHYAYIKYYECEEDDAWGKVFLPFATEWKVIY